MSKYYTTHEVALLSPNYGSARTLLKALGDNQKAKGEAKLKNDKELLTKLSNNKLSKIWNCRTREGKGWCYRKDEISRILGGK